MALKYSELAYRKSVYSCCPSKLAWSQPYGPFQIRSENGGMLQLPTASTPGRPRSRSSNSESSPVTASCVPYFSP